MFSAFSFDFTNLGENKMDKAINNEKVDKDFVLHHVMEPGPLSDRKLTGTWRDYITVTKVGIVLSNLMTAIAGMWLAAGGWSGFSQLPITQIVLTLLGTGFIIASGTCLNNYIDRDIDQLMERTKKRPSVDGRLEPKRVLLMGYILALAGTFLLLNVNIVATLSALFGLFVYVIVYTLWLKRAHHINTVVGGISGAMPPVIGWTAVSGSFDIGVLVFFVLMFIWQPPHFLALAIKRCEDYRKAGIPMLPVVKGIPVTKQQIIVWVASLIPASLYLYLVAPLNLAYVTIALFLGIGWLILALKDYKGTDHLKWASKNFLWSLLYLTGISLACIVGTF